MTQSNTPAAAERVAFSDLGLSEAVLAAVKKLGYTEPTSIQAQAIPYALEGRDLLAAAQTGTGKTAAFLLPSMSRLPHAERGHGPLMLVVTPTRELAQQIEDVCTSIARSTRHKCTTVVGGVGMEPQKAALRRGTDILVATPGRLVDLINQGDARLGEVEVLVLDEADRMLDMGFLPDMRRIVNRTPATRQTLLFSATLDEDAVGGIRDLVSDPAVVEIARKGSVAQTIDQYVQPVSLEAKNALLASVLKAEGTERVIVFCRTKHRVDACCRRLRKAGISCAPIHGDRKQNQRERALESFRAGKTDVLVATDVLARGIDVSEVRYVVNFDVPVDPEDYIHRIGRTGRAGEAGWALTFVTENDVDDLLSIERLMGMAVPAYEPDMALELGENPVALDPDRDPTALRPAGKRRAKKGGVKKGEAKKGDAKPAATKGKKDVEAAKPAEKPVVTEKPAESSKPAKSRKAAKPVSSRPAKSTKPEDAKSAKPAKKRSSAPAGDSKPRKHKAQKPSRHDASPKPTGRGGAKHRRRVGDHAGRDLGVH